MTPRYTIRRYTKNSLPGYEQYFVDTGLQDVRGNPVIFNAVSGISERPRIATSPAASNTWFVDDCPTVAWEDVPKSWQGAISRAVPQFRTTGRRSPCDLSGPCPVSCPGHQVSFSHALL